MAANMTALEVIQEQFLLFKKKYEKLLKEHLEKEGSGQEHGSQYTDLLKILHAELQSFAKLFELSDKAIERGELKPELKPEIKEALSEIAIMDLSLQDHSQYTETMLEERARKLAELLYVNLVNGIKSTNDDNSVTFLSKMRVFPRVTSINHLDPISAINSRKIIVATLKHLGDMYNATILDMRNKSQAQQDINVMRNQALIVYKALKDFSSKIPGGTAVTEHAEAGIAELTKDMAQEPKSHAHIRPQPPTGSSKF